MEWKKNYDNDYYIKCFKEQVTDKLDADNVIDDIGFLTGYDQTKNICLICYEKPTDFCHRHLVAKWLSENGYPCEEYNFNKN